MNKIMPVVGFWAEFLEINSKNKRFSTGYNP